jgi:hypothetical protein
VCEEDGGLCIMDADFGVHDYVTNRCLISLTLRHNPCLSADNLAPSSPVTMDATDEVRPSSTHVCCLLSLWVHYTTPPLTPRHSLLTHVNGWRSSRPRLVAPFGLVCVHLLCNWHATNVLPCSGSSGAPVCARARGKESEGWHGLTLDVCPPRMCPSILSVAGRNTPTVTAVIRS